MQISSEQLGHKIANKRVPKSLRWIEIKILTDFALTYPLEEI